jgi:hypothetical protein
MRFRLLVLLAVPVLLLAPVGAPAGGVTLASVEPAAGVILAPVARQAGWLSLDAPRPRLLTRVQAPSYVADLDVAATGAAALALQSMFPGGDVIGGDLLSLDLRSGSLQPLLTRVDAAESFGAPVWSADGGWLLFQRDDLRQPPVAYAYQANVRYPSRIEAVGADGSVRWVVVEDAHQPALSPDRSQLAFLRSSALGTALLVRRVDQPDERELIAAGRFPDIAHPRFSPTGDRIAFAAAVIPTARVGWFGVAVAEAHGLPWNIWTIGLDGSEPRLLAELRADDPSVAWSPDASQVFVYGGTGSFILDALTGEASAYPYLAGYGTTAWVPVF